MIRKHRLLTAYMLVLAIFTVYVVMDTFVIAKVYGDAGDAAYQTSYEKTEDAKENTGGNAFADTGKASDGDTGEDSADDIGKDSYDDSGSDSAEEADGQSAAASAAGSAVWSEDSYSDDNISVDLSEYTVENTKVYVAEVRADSPAYLKTAMANGVYGRNVTQTTSEIAGSVGAIIAVNGDYYGARENGYVIRNGNLYRSTSVQGQEDLVIYSDGSFGIIKEDEVSAEQLLSDGAVQTLSFGPALVEDGEISVDENDEVGRAMASNPRTAIGIKADGTYLFVVSDGRTDESEGLSLIDLAEFMKSQGAVTAYNLDGGGSSTMVFNGTVINNPTGGRAGHGSGTERSVSDIVYIGYSSTNESSI